VTVSEANEKAELGPGKPLSAEKIAPLSEDERAELERRRRAAQLEEGPRPGVVELTGGNEWAEPESKRSIVKTAVEIP